MWLSDLAFQWKLKFYFFKCDINVFLSTDFSSFKELFTANHSPSTLWATFDLLDICSQYLIYEVITVRRPRNSMTRWQFDWEGAAKELSLTLWIEHMPWKEVGRQRSPQSPRSRQVAASGGQASTPRPPAEISIRHSVHPRSCSATVCPQYFCRTPAAYVLANAKTQKVQVQQTMSQRFPPEKISNQWSHSNSSPTDFVAWTILSYSE